MNCPLCQSIGLSFDDLVFECENCGLVYKDSKLHLNIDEESKRYSYHINSIEDLGYVEFLNKLVNPLKDFLPRSFNALDFGCGPGPTIEVILKALGGNVSSYDPLFFPDEKLLMPEFYQVVTCTEVVEHFKSPQASWDQLTNLVADNGFLAIMTQFVQKSLPYKDWWYKNDPTHIVFYQRKTFSYLAKKYHMKEVYCDEKSVIIFKIQRN